MVLLASPDDNIVDGGFRSNLHYFYRHYWDEPERSGRGPSTVQNAISHCFCLIRFRLQINSASRLNLGIQVCFPNLSQFHILDWDPASEVRQLHIAQYSVQPSFRSWAKMHHQHPSRRPVKSQPTPMTLDEYIKVFRDECGEHLPWEEAREMEAVFVTRHPRTIFMELDKLQQAGRIPSKRFAKQLTNFYWQFL
jgi:hypothetical protein